jgi:hypothetical protein
MADKEQLLYYISQNFNFKQITNDLLKVEMATEYGRTQLVYVGLIGSGPVFLYSSFASALEVKPKKVLDLVITASKLSNFGIQIINNDFMLVHTISLNSLDLHKFHIDLGILARSADELEMELKGLNDFF